MMRSIGAGLFALCVVCTATAAEPADGEQRQRIAAERAQAGARLAEQEEVCRARFVVSACLDAARKEHSATLTRLHREEMQLDDAKRRAIAAARSDAVREKAAAQAARASDARGDAADAAPREAKRKEPRPNPATPPRPSGTRAHGSGASQRLEEQRNEAQFDARVREARAHREAVERRNAERAAKGKVAAPLPVPAGASAP